MIKNMHLLIKRNNVICVTIKMDYKPSSNLPQQSARFTMITSFTRTKLLNVIRHQGSSCIFVRMQLP